MTEKRPKSPILLICAVAWVLLTAGPSAFAFKVEVIGGAYSFSATNKRNNTNKGISGLGSYRLGLQLPFLNQFAADLGYSLLATDTISGDLSFGFDLGVLYFPFSPVTDLKIQSDSVSAVFQSRWRPFVGVAFHQRNFQSTSSQYAGTGLRLGTEMQMTKNLSITGCLRYMQLGGPNESQASEIDALAGALIEF